MTALTQSRITEYYGLLLSQCEKPVKEADRIYKGGMVGLDAAGDAVPGGDAAMATSILGRAMHDVDNTNGADGAETVRIEAGVFGYDNGDSIAEADLPGLLYCVDDQTVAKSSAAGTRKMAGVGLYLDEDGQVVTLIAPWVPVLAASLAAGGSGPSMQAVDATLVAGTVTIAAGITVEPDSEVVPVLIGAITGSTNFGSLGELKASRVDGAPGVGTVVIQAYGADGALDTDAAGAIRVLIFSPQG